MVCFVCKNIWYFLWSLRIGESLGGEKNPHGQEPALLQTIGRSFRRPVTLHRKGVTSCFDKNDLPKKTKKRKRKGRKEGSIILLFLSAFFVSFGPTFLAPSSRQAWGPDGIRRGRACVQPIGVGGAGGVAQ
jgi:hypothetical protein